MGTREGILAEFLKRNRAEAIKVSIYEYNEELHLENVRREGFEEGMTRGVECGIAQLQDLLIDILQELGDVSEELKDLIICQKDMAILSKWVKQASKSDTVEYFEKNI